MMPLPGGRWGAVLLLGAALGCSSSDATAPAEIPLEQQTWAASLGIDLATMTRLPSGVYYKDTVVGTGGTATTSSTVSVFYTGYLANAHVFDSNVGSTAVSFPLSELIDGWKFGIPGMRIGGTRRLVIPSALGYGPRGSGPIPANANLVFDIQLVGLN